MNLWGEFSGKFFRGRSKSSKKFLNLQWNFWMIVCKFSQQLFEGILGQIFDEKFTVQILEESLDDYSVEVMKVSLKEFLEESLWDTSKELLKVELRKSFWSNPWAKCLKTKEKEDPWKNPRSNFWKKLRCYFYRNFYIEPRRISEVNVVESLGLINGAIFEGVV